MSTPAAYIYSAYSFIKSLSDDELLQVGNLSTEGTPIPSFDQDLLIQLCKDAIKVFQNEPNIIEIEGDTIIVGDIHGSLHDLLRILRFIRTTNTKVVFLGDYVDRGNFSLECITLLFSLAILHPTTYFLLRGNHEFDDMCSHYGFKKEILNYHNPMRSDHVTVHSNKPKIEDEMNLIFEEEKEEETHSYEELCDSYFANHVNMNCYKYSEKLYNEFMIAFSYLPIGSIVNKTSLCIHGGLTPLLDKIENINLQIQRPINEFEENLLLSDILWGDPSDGLRQNYSDNQRGRGKLFSGPVVVNFLKNNNLKRLIRGHECVINGIECLFNDKCITVFSASSYSSHMGNSSGILKLYEKSDTFEPIIFPPIPRLKKSDTNYFKVAAFEENESHHVVNRRQSLSECKSGFLSSWCHLSAAHSEAALQSNHHFFPSTNEDKKVTPHEMGTNSLLSAKHHQNHLMMRRASLRSGPRKKIVGSSSAVHVIQAPHIFTPQLEHQNSDIISKSDTLPELT